MKTYMYLRSVAGYKYLFFYWKYEMQSILATSIYLSNKHIRRRNLVNYKYLFFPPKYEVWHASKTSSMYPNTNFAFLLVKIIMWGPGHRYIASNTCFCFFTYKNYNVEIAITRLLIVEAFLYNISLAIFTFLLINDRIAAIGILGWSHISIFAFLLVKTVAWG